MNTRTRHNQEAELESAAGRVLDLIRAYIQQHQLDRARALLENLPVSDRSTLDASRLEAEILWMEHRFADLDTLVSRLSRAGTNATRARAIAWLYRARISLKRGRAKTSIGPLQAFLKGKSTRVIPADLLGRLHLEASFALWRLGRHEASKKHLDRAETILQSSGDVEGSASCLVMRGIVAKDSADWKSVVSLTKQAQEIYFELGHKPRLLVSLINLSVAYLFLGNLEEAENYARLAIFYAQELGEEPLLALPMCNLGLVMLRQGRPAEAEKAFDKAMAVAVEHESERRTVALVWEYRGELALAQERLADATEHLEQARALSGELGDGDIEYEAQARLAEVALAEGNPARALELIRPSVAAFEEMDNRFEVAICRRVEGQALIALGRHDEARNVLIEARNFLDKMGERYEIRWVRRLIEAVESRGDAPRNLRALARPEAAGTRPTRELASTLLHQKGALEALLRLQDQGTRPIKSLIGKEIPARTSFDVISQLSRFDLVDVDHGRATITDAGSKLLTRLRRNPA